MRILIYGIGGIGGYFGGKMAKAGFDVSMIARGKHLNAIKQEGLVVESIKGNFKISPKLATDNIHEVARPDLVILGVKSWQVKEVAKSLKPTIGEDTMVLPLQNGADNVDKLLEVLPRENVLAGLCHIISYIEAPGKIKHTYLEPHITFGEIDNSKTERIRKVQEIFNKSAISNLVPEDIQLEIWKKFLFITTISGIGGLTRVPVDKIRESKYLYSLMQQTAQEIMAVGKAKGVALTQDHINDAFEIINKQPKGATASTQRDIMEGKPSEVGNFNGYIVKEGTALNEPTPINEFIYECLLPMETEARKQLLFS